MTPGAAILAMTLLFSTPGYRSGYEPYPEAPVVPLLACTEIEWPTFHEAVSDCGSEGSALPVRVRYTPEGACLAVGASSMWVTPASTLGAIEVYSAHLNGDQQPDIIAVFWNPGCGLASIRCNVVLALSGGSTFTYWRLDSMGFGPSALLMMAARPGVTLVQSEIAGGEGRDGRFHNYWIHTTYQIDGTTIRLTGEEPIWIMYAFRDNHVPTRQLTSSQKRSILAERSEAPQCVRLGAGCGS